MPKTITITSVKISRVTIDVARQCVIVQYSLQDSTNQSWGSLQEATFWVTMPDQTPIYDSDGVTVVGYQPYPDTWFQLPNTYKAPIINMVQDAKAALETKFLVDALR